ncbi:anthranilate synthase component II [Fodinicurvata sediminis]|uniref:anthranilate synthase component II n=1 Tax=Fodinicurvata sediminis TaxID=1121832 RepID=UPI00041A14AE|nr:aminodeoxychorismate/anthranilate synthase component II [Fodinicurvata sediminis]
MFVLIDNYDSFTYNLYHYLGEIGAESVVYRNDAISPDEVMAMDPEGIVLSPGPCTPSEAGICLDLIAKASGRIPILGVCLGHQAIGQAFGGRVVRAPMPLHGKLSSVSHKNSDVFETLPSPFNVTRYHSLLLDRDSMPDELEITAETDDGLVMGLHHRDKPLYGVQFHPESIASEYGHELLANFVKLARRTNA